MLARRALPASGRAAASAASGASLVAASGWAGAGRGPDGPPPNTVGKEIHRPVKLSMASGTRIQKPTRWWMLALVEFCRFQRKPRRKEPPIGHHSQIPVRQEMNM